MRISWQRGTCDPGESERCNRDGKKGLYFIFSRGVRDFPQQWAGDDVGRRSSMGGERRIDRKMAPVHERVVARLVAGESVVGDELRVVPRRRLRRSIQVRRAKVDGKQAEFLPSYELTQFSACFSSM